MSTDQFTTDRTNRQQRNADMVARLFDFAGENSRRSEAPVLKIADEQAQRSRVAVTRQSPFDLRDAFNRATGRTSADIDGAWQDSED